MTEHGGDFAANTSETLSKGGRMVSDRNKQNLAAANWWAELVSSSPSHDNGDGFQSALGRGGANRAPEITDELREEFAYSLLNRLDDEDVPWVCVGTDYDPDEILQDAIKDVATREWPGKPYPPAQIRQALADRLPWKTLLWIDPGGRVLVQAGYKKNRVEIYPVDRRVKQG